MEAVTRPSHSGTNDYSTIWARMFFKDSTPLDYTFKGHEVSEGNLGVLTSSKKPMIYFPDICPKGLKWVKSIKKSLYYVK